MLRAFFLAVGAFACLLGAECMFVDSAKLRAKEPGDGSPVAEARHVEPPEWAPWSLLSAGAVVILYSFTLPQRNG